VRDRARGVPLPKAIPTDLAASAYGSSRPTAHKLPAPEGSPPEAFVAPGSGSGAGMARFATAGVGGPVVAVWRPAANDIAARGPVGPKMCPQEAAGGSRVGPGDLSSRASLPLPFGPRMPDEALANALRRARLRNGLGQAELARLLGVSRGLVSHWETGRLAPNDVQLEEMKRHLGRIRREYGRHGGGTRDGTAPPPRSPTLSEPRPTPTKPLESKDGSRSAPGGGKLGTMHPPEMEALSNPILNTPFDPPQQHFEIGPNGPTGSILAGRRLSESFIPVPVSRKGRRATEGGQQELLDFDTTGERREVNSLINDIRREVELWRLRNWPGVTPYTRKLLLHWAALPPVRDEPVFFCQREAAETAIFLAEVAGRHGTADYRSRLAVENAVHNDGLPRIALKMATGTGKTVVMAMLIAWQTINKVMAPRDARFARRFLVVTPGITIRDRLGVLHPERDDCYYRERDLVPPDLWDALLRAQILVVNYHGFLPKVAKEVQGVATNTRKLLRGTQSEDDDPFTETPEMIAARIVRSIGSGEGGLVVMNDEAHHCYQSKAVGSDPADKEAEERNRDARVWLDGLRNLRRRADIKAIYDLSATPYYLQGSGWNEGFIFPWVADQILKRATDPAQRTALARRV